MSALSRECSFLQGHAEIGGLVEHGCLRTKIIRRLICYSRCMMNRGRSMMELLMSNWEEEERCWHVQGKTSRWSCARW